MATPRLGLVVEDKPTELSCNIIVLLVRYSYHPQKGEGDKGVWPVRLVH